MYSGYAALTETTLTLKQRYYGVVSLLPATFHYDDLQAKSASLSISFQGFSISSNVYLVYSEKVP